MTWMFETDPAWRGVVEAVPTGDRAADWYEVAVPQLAATGAGQAPSPCIVVAHVQTPRPVGPRGLAKRLMDALHDQRLTGVKHGQTAPLADDHPGSVAGLAVEVQVGPTAQVEYALGGELRIAGDKPIARLEIGIDCPNDVTESTDRIRLARRAFREATADAWGESAALESGALAVLIRHARGRDEDNTWEGWLGAIAPFLTQTPRAVASIADPAMECGVVYEIYENAGSTAVAEPRVQRTSVRRQQVSGDDSGLMPLQTEQSFAEALREPGVIVIRDKPTRTLRAHDPRCVFVKPEHFRTKVIEGAGATGEYLRAASLQVAVDAGATPCKRCLR